MVIHSPFFMVSKTFWMPLFFFSVLFLSSSLQANTGCFQNYVANSSFEEPPGPANLPPTFSGDWYFPDIEDWKPGENINDAGLFQGDAQVSAQDRSFFVRMVSFLTLQIIDGSFFWTRHIGNIATPLSKPLTVGKEYELTFWAKRDLDSKSAKVNIRMATAVNRYDYEAWLTKDLIATVKIKDDEWTQYCVEFEADEEYVQLFIGMKTLRWNFTRYIVLDNFNLQAKEHACCDGNLVPHAGFEDKSLYGGWESIHENYSNGLNSDISPVDVSTTGSVSEQWMTLYSFNNGSGLPDNYPNQAVTIRLKEPMKVGTYYHASFFGATKVNPFRGRAKLSMKVWTSPFCTSTDCRNDWDRNIGGTPIFDNFKLRGATKEWHYYKTGFMADRAYEYIMIQAKDGHHPAIDDICISAYPYLQPLEEPVLYYNTYNSCRQVTWNKAETTVDYLSSYDLFGLRGDPTGLYLANNAQKVHHLEPWFISHQHNPKRDLIEKNLATDMVADNNGNAYCAIDYQVQKVNSLTPNDPLNNLTPFPAASQVNTPFSLAVSGDYLFVLGVNQLSITNLLTNQTGLVQNHGVVMGGYMCFDNMGNLFIADPGFDAIRLIDVVQTSQLKSDLDANNPLSVNSSILSQGNNLSGSAGPDALVRGPIGVDFYYGVLWVTVDAGSGIPGSILQIDPATGNQTVFLNNVPGPRAIQVKR
jgi:hypothetical protein